MASIEKSFDRAEKADVETLEHSAVAESGESETGVDANASLKLDSNGLPLIPQPSRFRDDPLVSMMQCLILYLSLD
jgi:hypothetical protein